MNIMLPDTPPVVLWFLAGLYLILITATRSGSSARKWTMQITASSTCASARDHHFFTGAAHSYELTDTGTFPAWD
jgi:hypothetical protein